jgi:hypothetical protein
MTWNELQRRTGGSGLTREQISTLWEAHKRGVGTYAAFRTHCAGRGFDRQAESAMWVQHKLLAGS